MMGRMGAHITRSRCGARSSFSRSGGGGAPSDWTILEVGCSSGEFLALLPSEFRRFGIEPSPFASASAARRGVEILAPFFEDLDTQAHFDVVAAFSVLEHIRDPIAFLRRARGLTRDEGQLWIEVPNSLVPTVGVSEYFGFEHLSHFTLETLRVAMNYSGWRLEEIDEKEEKRLRVVASACQERSESPTRSDYHAIQAMLSEYGQRRAALKEDYGRFLTDVQGSVSSGGTVGIWGTGVHTRALLKAKPDLLNLVSVIVDANPENQGDDFEGLEIRKPEELPGLGVTHCIISSQAFFDEISASLQRVYADSTAMVVALSPYGNP